MIQPTDPSGPADHSSGPWKYPPRKPTRSLPEGSGIFVAIIPALALWALIAWVLL